MEQVRGWTVLGAAALGLALLTYARPTTAAEVFDQFFRYADSEHRAYYKGLPQESVDPFSGSLSIVQTEVVLPGKAGLDLRIVRSYSSKMWERTDLAGMSSLLAENARSVLGYGWSFHMGRIRNPNASGQPTSPCSGDYPVLEMPDGSARVFYRVSAAVSNLYVSRDYWRMETNCALLGGGGKGSCVWSTDGVRYEFSSALASSFTYLDGTLAWPVSAIVDRYGNRITVAYTPDQTGAVAAIMDTYGRVVTFGYQGTATGTDGKRLTTMTANGQVYQYEYTTYSTLAGSRRFLTRAVSPAGTAYNYQYATSVTATRNQYALSAMTYPHGGTVSFTYVSAGFYPGVGSLVPFAVVSTKSVTGRGGSSMGTWTYEYASPQSGMSTTTIGRPDGKADVYTMYGFGAAAAGSLWKVGLTQQVSRGSGAEVETYTWEQRRESPVAYSLYSAPGYAMCAGAVPLVDSMVYAPVAAKREVRRDGRTYTATYADWDDYGQPGTVAETGEESRSTTWTYFHAPVAGGATLNLVRGQPLTQEICVSRDCYENSWTYGGPQYARDSETQSGVRTTFTYHLADPEGAGNLQTVTNELGQRLSLSGYGDGHGTPTVIDFNGAFSIRRSATWQGWVQSETNGRGYTTYYGYDAIGRLKKVTPPGNNDATSFDYAGDGSWMTEVRGAYFKNSTLDGLGRTTGTVDSEYVKSSTRYDQMGRVWFKSYAYDDTTGEVGDRFEFDALGRVLRQTRAYRPAAGTCDQPGACRAAFTYANNCVSSTVERGDQNLPTTRCSTSFGSPDEQRLVQLDDANGSSWHYGYNAHGKLTSVIAPLAAGNRTYTYDANQYLSSVKSGESGITTYERNAIGQMTLRTEARSVAAHYSYNDLLSRLKKITYRNGSLEDVSKDYDRANNVTDIASGNGGAFHYEYDEVNRVTQQTWTTPAWGRTAKHVTRYGYDHAGCQIRMTYPSGLALTMTCDTANRVKSVSAGGAVLMKDVKYHPSGQVLEMTYGNGRRTTFAYDDRGRAAAVTVSGVVNLAYGYDGSDNVVSFEDASSPSSARTMTYDKLDRLETVIAPGRWGSAVYDYDTLGNRTLSSVGSATASFTYDGTTNRLATATGGQFRSMRYTWNLSGMLATSSDGVSYQYDGTSRRVRKAEAGTATVYHYDVAGRVIGETQDDSTKLRDYIFLGNKLVAISGCVEGLMSSTCDGLQWYHTDALGSVLARTDTNGAVVAQLDYQPWGEQWQPAGVQGDRQYNGRVFDPGTGFHDYGARMYWPQVGRFISPDTAAPDLANPATFNRYAYVLNNPYKYMDPTGLTPEGAFKGAMIGGSVGGAVGFLLGGGAGIVVAAGTAGGGVVAVPVGAIEGGALGSGIGIAIGHWVGDLVSGPDVMQANATAPYKRPSGATTPEQRASVQGKPCVDCGEITEKQYADHKTPLVREHYETGTIDKERMRSRDSVQPQCPTCSNKQGADMSRYSREQKANLPTEQKP